MKIAGDEAGVLEAARRLGTGEPGILPREFVDGKALQYGEVHDARLGAGRLGVCVVAEKPTTRPLGPSIKVTLLEDQEFRTAGAATISALAPPGLANMEFIRDRMGYVLPIDLSTRAWGNIGPLSLAGVDFIGTYLDWLELPGAGRWRCAGAMPAAGTVVRVFPAAVHELRPGRRWARFACEFGAELGPYVARFGLRFAAAALLSECAWLRDRRYERKQARAVQRPHPACAAPRPVDTLAAG